MAAGQGQPEVISYLEAENAYTEAQTAHLSELSDAVFSEIKARTKETDLSVPSYTSHPGARRTGTTFVPSRIGVSDLLPGCRERSRKLPDPEQEIVGEEVCWTPTSRPKAMNSSPSARSVCPSTGDCWRTRSI